LGRAEGPLEAGESLTLQFDFAANLGEGSYTIAIAAHDSETHMTKNYEWRDVALVFKVVNLSLPPFVGTAYLPTSVSVGAGT
jgi:lipopolysaccharide transport system ATP-binding protein